MDTRSASTLFRGAGLSLCMIFRVVCSFTRLILYGLSGVRPRILRGVRIFHGCSSAAHSSHRVPCCVALIIMRTRLLTVRITLGMPIFRVRSITGLTILWDAPTGKASFRGSVFDGWVGFTNSSYSGSADFSASTYRAGCDFSSSHYRQQAIFENSFYGGAAIFHHSVYRRNADFGFSVYADQSNFSGSSYHGAVRYLGSVYAQTVNAGACDYTQEPLFVSGTDEDDAASIFGSDQNTFASVEAETSGLPLGCWFMSSTEVEYLAEHEQELSQILEEMRQTGDAGERKKLRGRLRNFLTDVLVWRDSATQVGEGLADRPMNAPDAPSSSDTEAAWDAWFREHMSTETP